MEAPPRHVSRISVIQAPRRVTNAGFSLRRESNKARACFVPLITEASRRSRHLSLEGAVIRFRPYLHTIVSTDVNRYPTKLYTAFHRATLRACGSPSFSREGQRPGLFAHHAIPAATWPSGILFEKEANSRAPTMPNKLFPRARYSLTPSPPPFFFVSSAKYGCVHGTDR